MPDADSTKTVLVIEDSPVVAWAIRKALTRAGYEVIEADADISSGKIFRIAETIRKHNIAVVILDLALPGLSGEDIGRLLSNQSLNHKTIIYSSADNERIEAACKLIDVSAYVQKHHDMSPLTAAVHRAISISETVEEKNSALKTLLIVDDDPDEHLFFGALLRNESRIRIVFSDTGWIHKLIQVENPDMILIDYSLGGILNGADVTKSLKKSGLATSIPVLIYSAIPQQELVQAVADSGADGFLPKNTAPKEVASIILDYLKLAT